MRSGLCVVLAFLMIFDSCASPNTSSGPPPSAVLAATSQDEVTVNVLELICQSCAEHIIGGCRAIEGVTSVEVDRRERLITLHFDPARTSRERVIIAVDNVVATIP